MLIIIIYGGFVITGAIIISATLKGLELADKKLKELKEKA